MPRRIGRRAILKSAVAAGGWLVAGALGARYLGGKRSNIIIIVSDALRSDYIGKVADGVSVMPNIDRLAESGTRFTSCIAPSSWTLFSVPGLLCSQAPLPTSKRIEPGTGYFRDGSVNVAEVFSGARMSTAAVVKNPWLYQAPAAARNLYSRGFESYHAACVTSEENPLFSTFGGRERIHGYQTGEVTTRQAVNVLERRRLEGDDRPFFLYLHYMDTHEPYYPPEGFRKRFVRTDGVPGLHDKGLTRAIRILGRARGERVLAEGDMAAVERSRELYTAAAAYVDSEVERFFDYLKGRGLYDDSVIVFTSDHGEEFGEHGWIGHSRTLYREVLEVPLVIAGKGVERGKVVDEVVGSVDIVPALLAMGDVEAPEGVFEGEAGVILEGTGAKDVVSTSKYPNRQPQPDYLSTSITTRTGKKYIRTCHLDDSGETEKVAHEVYDLRRDGGETDNLAGEHGRFCRLRSDEIDSKMVERAGQAGMRAEVPEGMEEAITALGYLN